MNSDDPFRDDSGSAAEVYIAADIIVALAFFGIALLAAALLIGLGLWIV